MEYGLIGENVTRSLSKSIHNLLGSFPYELISIPNEKDFVNFIKSEDFKGLNITIPYKQIAFKNCDYVDMLSNKLGVVNTLVKKEGKLYGYNTDVSGFIYAIKSNKIDVFDKNCIILGTGATSKTVEFALQMLGAKSIYFLSRNPDYIHSFNYDNSVILNDVNIVINTTPKNTIPLLNIDLCNSLEAFIDVNYYPYRSPYLVVAYKKHVKSINGLSMLVAQAVGSSSYFLNKQFSDSATKDIYKKIKADNQNIILTGHPFSGKTTIGIALANSLNKGFVDLDNYIENKYKTLISDIFREKGEKVFREYESFCIKEILENKNNIVLSLGGGALEDIENLDNLLSFGLLINLRRNLDLISESELIGRPLIKSKTDLINLIKKREKTYNFADFSIDNNSSIDSAVSSIKELI